MENNKEGTEVITHCLDLRSAKIVRYTEHLQYLFCIPKGRFIIDRILTFSNSTELDYKCMLMKIKIQFSMRMRY